MDSKAEELNEHAEMLGDRPQASINGNNDGVVGAIGEGRRLQDASADTEDNIAGINEIMGDDPLMELSEHLDSLTLNQTMVDQDNGHVSSAP
jgi:hypothetical protein